MVLDTRVEQQEITNWFNRTYSTRGEYYLRPVKAYYIFLELLKVSKQETILDVACGLGRLLEAALEYDCNLYGIDISKEAVSRAKQKLPSATIVEGNAELLPFEDGFFDYVSCLGSLERIIDKQKALSEMKRVTNNNAKFCFLVRNSESFSWKYIKRGFGLVNRKGHQGALNLQEWTQLFEQNGFNVDLVLHDQYPIYKFRKLLTLGIGNIDIKSPIHSHVPLSLANEFIFILSKK